MHLCLYLVLKINSAVSTNRTRNQWVDLGVHTEACMTRPETCGAAGGAISVWINVVIECTSAYCGVISSWVAGSTGSSIYLSYDGLRYDLLLSDLI